MTDCTAIISGGGPSALTAAILLAQGGVKTTLIAPAITDDLRTTALMQPAIRLLEFIGVWPGEIIAHCAPLKRLHVLDDTGNLVAAPKIEFMASELGFEEFGFNTPLALLIPALHRRAEMLGVNFLHSKSVHAVAHDENIAVETEAGTNITGKVLLIADGAASPLRKALGFHLNCTRFEQMALATSFDHSASHEFTSTEFHKAAGPFTTVPLPGNRSSLVWMARPSRIEALLALSEKDLCTEIQLEGHGLLGRISNLGPRKAFQMQSSSATVFAKSRAMLVGEAAHALPPIGAQGLNLSLRDAATAADLIIAADDPGSASIATEYDKQRRADVAPRVALTGLLNASLLSELSSFHLARAAGLAAVAHIAPLRQLALRQGLGTVSELPVAMRG